MFERLHHTSERLRETFVVEGNPSQTRGRIIAGAMIYVPAVVGGVIAVLLYLGVI